jgi:electron transport complex protein RnfC
MIGGLKLPKHKDISLSKDVLIYDKPKYVYIPLAVYNNLSCTPMVKPGDYVYVGDVIGKRNDHFKLSICSSVSGEVEAIEKRYHSSGHEVDCIKIKNDFKNKVLKKEFITDITDYSKTDFISILQTCGVVGMSGTDFPTYIKYNTNKKINTLLVNGTECEPYITSDYILLKNNIKEICEGIHAILRIMNINKAVIAIKKGHPELKKIILDEIDSYSCIELKEVKDYYPIGWEGSLIKTIFHKKYDKLPLDIGIVVNNVTTIHAIYQVLRNKHSITDRIVTITGDKIKKPVNVLVKIGTSISEVIKFIDGYKRGKKLKLIAGGPMTGHAIHNDSLVVSANLNGIVVKEDDFDTFDDQCIRCGKCTEVCPVKICPVLVKDHIDDIDELKALRPDKCIECGLCSYICPAKIELREYVKNAKSKVVVK